MNPPEPAPPRPRWQPGEDPAGFVATVDGQAKRVDVRVGGCRMAWRRWGEPEAPALVLVHGGFGSWRHFALNVVPLAHRHAVYAVDLPGHGDSEDLPGGYDAGSVSGALGAALDRVLPAPRGYHLCGFSFGGIMSGLAAVGQGARVTTWVGVAPGGLGLPIASLPRLERAGSDLPPERRSEVHRENLQRLMIADPARADDLAVYLQAETVRLARGRSGRIPFTHVLAQALPRVAAPRHAIWGEHDVIGGPFLDGRRDFFRALDPLGTFQVLAGAGHWVMYEQPEAFEAALEKVLEDGGEVGGRDRPAMRR